MNRSDRLRSKRRRLRKHHAKLRQTFMRSAAEQEKRANGGAS